MWDVRSSHCDSAVMNLNSIHEDSGSIPGLTWWVKDPGCHEMQCRSQTQLRSQVVVTVVQAGSCCSDLALARELPYATGVTLKSNNKLKNKIVDLLIPYDLAILLP